jgi:maleylpyruvate isomerase
VRIGLHLKGIAYEDVPVHLVRDGGEQRTATHRARNPLAQVPVLELPDGRFLTQSLAILRYLDSVVAEPRLFPEDGLEAAHALMLAEVVNSGIQPLQNLSIGQKIASLGGNNTAWFAEVIHNGLTGLEAMSEPLAGRFLVGDRLSVADICLIPQLYNARRFDVPLDGFPTLLAVEAACTSLPAFQAAHPDAQPDATP